MADNALAVARSLDDPLSLDMTLWILSATMQVLGDIALAAQHAEASRQPRGPSGTQSRTCVLRWLKGVPYFSIRLLAVCGGLRMRSRRSIGDDFWCSVGGHHGAGPPHTFSRARCC